MVYKTVIISKVYKDELVFIVVELDKKNPYMNSIVRKVFSSYKENDKYLGKRVSDILEEYGDEFRLMKGLVRTIGANASKTL